MSEKEAAKDFYKKNRAHYSDMAYMLLGYYAHRKAEEQKESPTIDAWDVAAELHTEGLLYHTFDEWAKSRGLKIDVPNLEQIKDKWYPDHAHPPINVMVEIENDACNAYYNHVGRTWCWAGGAPHATTTLSFRWRYLKPPLNKVYPLTKEQAIANIGARIVESQPLEKDLDTAETARVIVEDCQALHDAIVYSNEYSPKSYANEFASRVLKEFLDKKPHAV